MGKINWSAWTDPVTVAKRAGGRRHYHAIRRLRAAVRRAEVADLLLAGRKQTDIAKALGVADSTISRDVKRIYADAARRHICPLCRREYHLCK